MNGNITGKVIINLVALLMLTAMGVQAATIYQWTGTTGNWNDGSNWDNGIPTAGTSDGTRVTNGGTAIIPPGYDSAVSGTLWLGDGGGTSGHIVQNGGTLTIDGGFYVGRYGAGTYTLNGGLLDYNGTEFTLGRFGDANSGAASFYQKGGEVQAAGINLSRAGSLYEISGGTFTGGSWGRVDNTTIRVIGSAASINVTSGGFGNATGGAYLEFVLDNSTDHISTVTHTGATTMRRQGHLVAKLNGGVLLSSASQFNLVRSDSTMASYSWASTPGDLWTYAGNVLDGGKYYERISLAGPAAGTFDPSIQGNRLDLGGLTYGYVTLENASIFTVALDFGEAGTDYVEADLNFFKAGLSAAGLNWSTPVSEVYEVSLTLDPSVSGSNYFAWDLSDYNSLQLHGVANIIPEPSSFLLFCLGGLVLMCARRRRG